MPDAKTRYFRLHDGNGRDARGVTIPAVGIEPEVTVEAIDPDTGVITEKENPKAGELAPLNSVGVRVVVAVDVLEDGTIVREPRSVELTEEGAYETVEGPNGKPIRVGLADTNDKILDPQARILALTSGPIIDGIVQCDQYEEITTPKAAQPRKPKDAEKAEEE